MSEQAEKAREDYVPTPEEQAQREQHMLQFYLVSSMLGFNELAKKSEDLREKAWFISMREGLAEKARSEGVEVDAHGDWPVLLTLSRQIHLDFSERDIELMRRLVRQHDEKRDLITIPKERLARWVHAVPRLLAEGGDASPITTELLTTLWESEKPPAQLPEDPMVQDTDNARVAHLISELAKVFGWEDRSYEHVSQHMVPEIQRLQATEALYNHIASEPK